jgi:alcohol dehydrogenase class IV
LQKVPELLKQHGWRSVALFTGSKSFRDTEGWNTFSTMCTDSGITLHPFIASGEPSPEFIDQSVESLRSSPADAVLSIGGGSVIDSGKAVSAMLAHEGSVRDYLEGVGEKKPTGEKIPFMALPTTSGTGSEASKNAVISEVGEKGFKKSLRHDSFVPDYAVIDPELVVSCPESITAASGLDAITQLMEAFVSTKASPMTDSLAIGGLMAAGRSFDTAVSEGTNLQARSDMAYAAFISGITLANAGLGLVHGIASPLGGHYPIPHGVACGTLIAEATRLIIDRLFDMEEPDNPALLKYAECGKYLRISNEGGVEENCDYLVSRLEQWIDTFSIPTLSEFGIQEDDLETIAQEAGIKNTPVELSKEDIVSILKKRL